MLNYGNGTLLANNGYQQGQGTYQQGQGPLANFGNVGGRPIDPLLPVNNLAADLSSYGGQQQGGYQQGQGPLRSFGAGANGAQQQLGQQIGQQIGQQPDVPEVKGLTGYQKAGIGLNAANSVLSGYLGIKQYGLAKDQLRFQKDSFNKNYAAQKSSFNRDLERSQERRVGADPNQESVESYVARHRIE